MILSTIKAREKLKPSPFTELYEEKLTLTEQLSIYEQLIPGIRLGKAINSPLRKDNHPSFCIYKSKSSDNIYWRDYGSGESGNVYLLIGLMKGNVTPKPTSTKIYDHKNILDFIDRAWAASDYDIWAGWGVPKEILTLYNVKAASTILVNGSASWKDRPDCPIYVYLYGKSMKVYRPFAPKQAKWKSDINNDDIQGYEQLPVSGDLLIITKSLKDVMCLHELGYAAIAPSSETTFISNTKLLELRKRFKNILLFFDNDKTGVASSASIKEKYNIKYILLPKNSKCKDISDYYQKFGREACLKVIDFIIDAELNPAIQEII